MNTFRALAVLSVLVLALSWTSCSNNNSPSNGSNNGSNSGSCRTFATSSGITTVNGGITLTSLQTTSFDSSKKQYTVVEKFNDGSLCSTAVENYNSVADFVDEVSVIPGRVLFTGNTGTNSGQCGSGSSTSTNRFDSQRRLMQIVGPNGSTTTYTAWDSSGRPTAGTTSSGGTLALVYDQNARTVTITGVSGGVTSVTVETVDANGNPTSEIVTQPGNVNTTTYNNTTFATVCK